MRKHTEFVEINGITFEYCGEIDKKDTPVAIYSSIKGYSTIGLPNIYQCYDRPSATKVAIYNNWAKWFLENDGDCGVISYNCNFFTLAGKVKCGDCTMYLVITKAHNRAYRVV